MSDNASAPNSAMASPPPLLREWSYTGPQQSASPEPPVAPAVVVEEESPTKSYPVATFVSNFVRNSIDHINVYAGIAETVDDGTQQVPLTSRSDDVDALRRMNLNVPDAQQVSARSAPEHGGMYHDDLEFDDADLYIVDGDLVAMAPPPPTPEEMEDIEFHSRRNQRMRKNLRGLRKWIKKRATRKQDDEERPVCSDRQKKTKRRQRRRSERRDDEPMASVTELHAPRTSTAVSADFIGNADTVLYEAGVLNVASADAYIETDDKIDELAPPAVQAEKLDVESMLCLARQESDLEQSMDTVMDPGTLKTMLNDLETPCKPQARGDGCPLSSASCSDEGVYNDTLKIVMVGGSEKSNLARALRNSPKKGRRRTTLGVDVHTWTHSQINFSIWDVQGANREDGSANSGAHPSTQSLFFSPNSLYVLVWDLAVNNFKTHRRMYDARDDEDDDEDDNEFLIEEFNRHADSALEADIYERVLTWVDCIPPTNSAILPVVTIPQGMDEWEIQRRCSMMQAMLMNHLQSKEPKLIFGNESILRVDLTQGVEALQETIIAIATDERERVFEHVRSPVPPGTVDVLHVVHRLKQDHKVILLDHLLAEMNAIHSIEEVTTALQFLASIGELLYFGTEKDDVLSRYIILSRKWLVSALSCILRNDLKRELAETRRFMNMQCAFSGQEFPENDIMKTFLGSNSNSSCPILSSTDSSMLWQSMSFMREAADRTSKLSEAADSYTMFQFLERLLVHKGVFLPLNVSQAIDHDPTPTYFVPSLLSQGEPSDVWTYKSSDSWMTTICHSWLLRDGAPANLMEQVSVSLIQDLYEFSHTIPPAKQLTHSSTFPLGHPSMSDFLHEHESVGRIKIHHIMCWKSSILVKIGCVFAEPDSDEIRESFAEIFVSLVDPQSVHCVSSNSIGTGMTRLVICGKGQAGHHGKKLWKGGYGLALDSIKASLADLSNVDRQVVCPECLAHSHPSTASTWEWDSVRSCSQLGNSGVRCMRGHLVDTNLLCGTCNPTSQSVEPVAVEPRVSKPVSSLLGGVVLVGLWDSRHNQIRNVGSGFVVDKKQGLIVTAGHILFDMAEGRKFGTPYFGLKHAKAVIGVIPEGSHTAVFRYFADIVAHDINNIDACVLRITTKMEKDVEGEGEDCANQPEIPLVNDVDAIKAENLEQLKMTRSFELEEAVRILGFNQGGEGLDGTRKARQPRC